MRRYCPTLTVGVTIIATRVGTAENAKNSLVVAGPHGDERNAQRLVLGTQRTFESNSSGIGKEDSTYFIPSLSPTAAFADIRDFPASLVANKKIAGYSENISDATYGDLITNLSIEGNKNRNGGKDGNTPVINTNRDALNQQLSSTVNALSFFDSINSTNKSVIFQHGYQDQGTVFSGYKINADGLPAVTNSNGAEAIAKYLFGTTMTQDFFGIEKGKGQTPKALTKYLADFPGEYAGYLPKKDWQVYDIELPEQLKEGKRPGDNNWTPAKYSPQQDINNMHSNSLWKKYQIVIANYWKIYK